MEGSGPRRSASEASPDPEVSGDSEASGVVGVSAVAGSPGTGSTGSTYEAYVGTAPTGFGPDRPLRSRPTGMCWRPPRSMQAPATASSFLRALRSVSVGMSSSGSPQRIRVTAVGSSPMRTEGRPPGAVTTSGLIPISLRQAALRSAAAFRPARSARVRR